MYKAIENGEEIVLQGIVCHLPPVGKGIAENGDIQSVEVLKRSENPSEQYWESEILPDNYEELREQELSKQEIDPDYYDHELEQIRAKWWHRRIYGIWVYINGKPVYLTGLYWFYLNCWSLDTGLPMFRIIDLEWFYVWMYCVQDPICYGLVEVCKRRNGKTARSACMIYECLSRTERSLGGMQSKTLEDAEEIFDLFIVPAFQQLPHFFIPIYDQSKGSTPKKALLFQQTSVRGKEASKNLRAKQLKSEISFKESKPRAYDGKRLKRYIGDERGKVDFDVIDAHITTRKCLVDMQRKIVGKMLITTTVELMGIEFRFDELWKWSNQNKRELDGRTKSGLYRFFMPADRSGEFNIYGEPLLEKNRMAIYAEREKFKDSHRDLVAEIRKEPLTEEEAFRVSNSKCHFDLLLLNDLFDNASSVQDEVIEYGNYHWKEGKQFTESIWEKCQKESARWMRPKLFEMPDPSKTVEWRGSLAYPLNTVQFISGADPFQNDIVESGEGSKGSIGTLNRYESGENNMYFNRMFILKYLKRPLMAKLFHMDLALHCFATGSKVLIESKMDGGCRKFFMDNGLEPFLIRLPDKENYGIDPNQDNKVLLLNLWETYLYTEGREGKLIYPSVIKQLSSFDINETEISDEVMGLGWTLVADFFNKANFRTKADAISLLDFFPKRAI